MNRTTLSKLIGTAIVVFGTAHQAAEASPWILRHGLTDAQYQDFYDNELPAGYRPLAVNVHGQGASERYAAVWVSDGAGPWVARHNMSSADYQTEATTQAGNGYRVISVDATGTYPNEEYAAVWVNDGVAPADWGSVHRQTSAQMQTVVDNYANAGFRPVCLTGVGSGSSARFAASFVRNFEGWSYDAVWDLTEAQYQTYVEDRAIEGYRPMYVTGYGSGADTRLGAIFVRPDGTNWKVQSEWVARHNQDGTAFQTTADDLVGTLYQPLCPMEYGSTSSPEFGSVWVQDTPDPVFTATGVPQPFLTIFDSVMQNFMTSRKFQRATLAITKDQRLVYNRAFTYDYPAQWDTQPTDRFRVASVSKPITAVAVLKAVEMGLFDLDDALVDIPGVDSLGWANGNQVGTGVTVRMLLQHRGGWDRDVSPDPMFQNVTISNALNIPLPIQIDDIVTYMKTQPLDFAPGSDYTYSNFGYALLGEIIEAASGMSYEDFVRENVLCPIGAEGMQQGRSLVEGRLPDEVNYRDPMNRYERSIMSDDRPLVKKTNGGFNIENMAAHGAWVATGEELAKFVSEFTTMTGSDLLDNTQIDFMFNENPQTSAYGSGWQRTGTTRYHNGSLRGTWSFIIRRDDGVTISVIFNGRSNGVNTPVADDDWDIFNDLQNAADLVDLTPSLRWPTGDLFTPGTCDPNACPGDVTHDGIVDGSDLARLLAAWGSANPDTDFNGDGDTNGSDLAVLLASWGRCP